MNDFYVALELLPLGMITVFVILFLVIYVGRLIIWVTNHFPETEILQNQSAIHLPQIGEEAHHVAVLVAAVSAVTQGEGSIQSISKISKTNN